MGKSQMDRWNEQYQELVNFYRKNNHFKVSKKESTPLYNWLYKQRNDCKLGVLSKNREAKLNELGDWTNENENRTELDSKKRKVEKTLTQTSEDKERTDLNSKRLKLGSKSKDLEDDVGGIKDNITHLDGTRSKTSQEERMRERDTAETNERERENVEGNRSCHGFTERTETRNKKQQRGKQMEVLLNRLEVVWKKEIWIKRIQWLIWRIWRLKWRN